MILGETKMKIQEYQKIKNEEIEALKFAISTIAEIIHYQMPLRYQDEWLKGIVDNGIWKPDLDEEEE
jgi:hypothetical protein|tara:strand:- start:511 stop:711 length:201 start_codon:yes stop_codon:yes gene_type:complete